MMAEEKSPSRFFFAPSLTLRNGEEDGIKIRACELFIWYGYKARGTCAGRCVSGDSRRAVCRAHRAYRIQGKSTLVQHLNGLLSPSEGKILYDGRDVWEKEYPRKELRSNVGLVFQYPEHQLFETDVFADVCFGPKNLGLEKEEIERRANRALELVGFPKDAYGQSPFELSGGQKRRVAIAGVLAMEPKILVLDEPTAGLDPKGRDEILGQISHLQKETGISVVLVSHSMEDVANYVDTHCRDESREDIV